MRLSCRPHRHALEANGQFIVVVCHRFVRLIQRRFRQALVLHRRSRLLHRLLQRLDPHQGSIDDVGAGEAIDRPAENRHVRRVLAQSQRFLQHHVSGGRIIPNGVGLPEELAGQCRFLLRQLGLHQVRMKEFLEEFFGGNPTCVVGDWNPGILGQRRFGPRRRRRHRRRGGTGRRGRWRLRRCRRCGRGIRHRFKRAHHSKTQVGVADHRAVAIVAHCAAAEGSIVVPIAPANDAAGAGLRTFGVVGRRLGVPVVARHVGAPFFHVAVHVVESERISRLESHRVGGSP